MNNTLIKETESIQNQHGVASVDATLKKYSLSGHLAEFDKSADDSIPLLGGVAATGQNTVIYAASNTGKTLLTLKLLADSIRAGRVKGSNVFYINVDDHIKGVLEKLAFAEQVGFELLVEGHKGFTAKKFTDLLIEMIDGDTARGQIIVLDTLKKFVDIMNKSHSTGFGGWLRQFNLKGGTVIVLAHTNKNPTSDGKPQYSGTNDIVSDVDCALYLLDKGIDKETGKRIVEFKNFKGRGGVVKSETLFIFHDRGGELFGSSGVC